MNYTIEELQNVLPSIEQQYGSLQSVALAFNLQHPVVASTVIGARSKQQLLQNLQAYNQMEQCQPLDVIDELVKHDRYQAHR